MVNLKFRQLQALVLVIELRSFAAAAEQLAVTPPSFSALIKALEDDLGVALMERTTRSCRPTEAGRQLYDRIRGPLGDLADGYAHVRDIGRGVKGTLRLGALPSLASGMVTLHLATFQRQHPDVRIRLRERQHDDLLGAVRRGDVELGVGVMLRPDDELVFEHLCNDRLLFVVPAGHPLEALPPTWKCLERFPYIYVGNGNTEQALAAARVRTSAAYEVGHVATALAMVRQGLGVSVLPSSAIPSLNVDGLRCIPIRGEMAIRRIGIVRKAGRPSAAAARAFIALLQREISHAAA